MNNSTADYHYEKMDRQLSPNFLSFLSTNDNDFYDDVFLLTSHHSITTCFRLREDKFNNFTFIYDKTLLSSFAFVQVMSPVLALPLINTVIYDSINQATILDL